MMISIKALALLSVLVTISQGCSSYDIKNFICEVYCIKDFFAYLSQETEMMTNLTLTLKGNDCDPVPFKDFGANFKHLKSLKINSVSCPFKDLSFDEELTDLENLELISKDTSRKDHEELVHGHEMTHQNLRRIKINGFCCDRVWNSVHFPNLEDLNFRCSDAIVSVKSTKPSNYNPDPYMLQFFAPNLVKYDTVLYKIPTVDQFLADLVHLKTINIYVLFKEYGSLPYNFLYNLPSLEKFYLSGLSPLKRSDACRYLGARNVKTIVLADISPNFIQSCPEILTSEFSQENRQHLTLGIPRYTTENESVLFNNIDQLNATTIRFYNMNPDQEKQFPDSVNFEALKNLYYENVKGDVNLYEIIKLRERLPNLEDVRIEVKNCKRELTDAMIKYLETDNKLEFECEKITCLMDNEEKNLCRLPKKTRITKEDFNFTKACEQACKEEPSSSMTVSMEHKIILFSTSLVMFMLTWTS